MPNTRTNRTPLEEAGTMARQAPYRSPEKLTVGGAAILLRSMRYMIIAATQTI